ncbi:MAG: hypothetical protein M0D55_00985 [Elusimicrobiota bacterium]|nr:MAG: hypothetical protein M0D55_00985 [Elusimicrobiota bacterium]
MSHRHVCVHGHFYQPPRENPWTGSIDREASAAPFHDWNARIAEECYGPITLGVRAGSDGRVIAYDETLKRLSYDFGPTLLSWMERERPSLLRRVLDADAATRTAIAHPYFHNILPLESRRDKETLVRWGVAEFKRRFGREPKGFWLPETAVDVETLEVLASEGLEFTILDPKQGEAVRDAGASAWTPLDADHVDPKTPYSWTSPTDPSKRLTIFFYHRRISQGVVSGDTTSSAEHFADAVRARLMPNDAAQLAHIASDGEFYGHHHPGAERVLASALDLLEADGIPPIDPSRFLALFPRRTRCVSGRTPRGAASTDSAAGSRTAAAAPLICLIGAKLGARRCATRSSSSPTAWTRSTRTTPRASSRIPGRSATSPSSCGSTPARRTPPPSCARTRSGRCSPRRSAARLSCSRCSASASRCSRAAAGSSTTSRASRPS